MTCHNRVVKTLACLDSLRNQNLVANLQMHVILADDNSTDNTPVAVAMAYPDVEILNGDGKLYWNGGMRVAFDAAIKLGFDNYLWLNDDTLLYPQALYTLIQTSKNVRAEQGKPVIVVGSTQDCPGGQQTYGGVNRTSIFKPTAFKRVMPQDVAVRCDSMNGNCVLVPSEIVKVVGSLEPRFAHAMGDLDYGLRAGYAGFEVWLMPGYAGTCSNNLITGSYKDQSIPLLQRLHLMLQPKGLPLNSWRVFTQRHSGMLWPLYWLWPYVKVILRLG